MPGGKATEDESISAMAEKRENWHARGDSNLFHPDNRYWGILEASKDLFDGTNFKEWTSEDHRSMLSHRLQGLGDTVWCTCTYVTCYMYICYMYTCTCYTYNTREPEKPWLD